MVLYLRGDASGNIHRCFGTHEVLDSTPVEQGGQGGVGCVGRSVSPSASSRVALGVLAAGVLAAPSALWSTVQRRRGDG
eukprot:scaffold72585_cov56-Phaeocystis_antarctica.AAC.1